MIQYTSAACILVERVVDSDMTRYRLKLCVMMLASLNPFAIIPGRNRNK